MSADPVAAYAAFLKADQAASVAHDFIYGKNDVTQKEASDAIWVIHETLRPYIVLDGDDVAGNLEGDSADRLLNITDSVLRDYLRAGSSAEDTPRG